MSETKPKRLSWQPGRGTAQYAFHNHTCYTIFQRRGKPKWVLAVVSDLIAERVSRTHIIDDQFPRLFDTVEKAEARAERHADES